MCCVCLHPERRSFVFHGGAAGNVKLISNCESFSCQFPLGALSKSQSQKCDYHTRARNSLSPWTLTSLTQPPVCSPLPSLSVSTPPSVDLFLLLCLVPQRRRSTTWRVSWRSMASRCPPSARLAGSWPMSCPWTKLHVRGARMSRGGGGIWSLLVTYCSLVDSCFHNETDQNILESPVVSADFDSSHRLLAQLQLWWVDVLVNRRHIVSVLLRLQTLMVHLLITYPIC